MGDLVNKEYLSKQFAGYSTVVKGQLDKKVNIEQGVDNKGKLLGVDDAGNVSLVDTPDSVKVSQAEGNAIETKDDGIYVSTVSETKVSEAENNAIEVKGDGIYVAPTDLTNYVEKVDGKGLSTNDLTDEMVEKIGNTYTKTEVDTAITNAQLGGEDVDLTGYVKTETLTETLADYAKTEDIPEAYDDTALSDRVTANEEAIATLNGTGEGSVYKTVDDALNKFATDISDDGVVNTYKELVDYAASHSSDIAEMVTDIADNATAIEELNTKVTDLETSVEGVYTKDETDELIKDELYTEVTTPAHYELSSIGVDGALEIVADGTATDGQIDISNVTDITVNIGDYVIFVDESTTYTEKYVSKVEGKGLSTNDLTDEIVEKIENTYSKDETYSRTEIDEKITESQTGMDVYSTDDWDSFYSALSIDATTI